MNINTSAAASAVSAATQAVTGDAVNTLVLNKALKLQASGAMNLIQSAVKSTEAINAQNKLATSGNLGTRLNTVA